MLRGGRARLGELAGDAAHLHHRNAGAVGEDHRHLQDDLELVPDAVGRELGERLGAVPGLQQKGPAAGDVGQSAGQAAGLAGEHQRGEAAEGLQDLLQGVVVGPLRLLGGRTLPPALGAPLQRRS